MMKNYDEEFMAVFLLKKFNFDLKIVNSDFILINYEVITYKKINFDLKGINYNLE